MALGCFLWISGICFLLFDGSVGLPAIKGYGYPYIADSRNMEDEALMFDDWQASNGQPSGAAYTSYNNPSAAWQPVATRQTVPSAPAVESFVNSESGDWNLRNSNAPLNFPLSHKPSNPARPQPGPNTGSSTHGGGSQNVPHLVYEEVIQYPSENAAQSPSDGGVSNTAGGAGYMSTGYSSEPSYQKYPANAGPQQVATSAQMSYQPQNPVASPEKEVSVRVSEPLLPPPPPPPSSYIVQSRDAYRRSRYLFNKSRYSPGFAPPLAVRSVPARRQPAAPVGVKNPKGPRIHG
ncbi:cuticle collagen bli-1 [Hippoglossus stenolepis]|uniref:cuticle collagen bli-1 n=1 Tax=Hippoglossus stenolepis TaxID=195615 RepID=UPI00159C70F7|nr:cuticle collagen bli-1 [Hippoglossus stenolepis]